MIRGLTRWKRMMRIFKKGDLVRITDNVHVYSMPASRMGHLIGHATVQTMARPESDEEFWNPTPRANVAKAWVKDGSIWWVHMTNSQILKFHEMHLIHVEEL